MTKPLVSSSPAPNAGTNANRTKPSVFSRITSAAKRATDPSAGKRSVSDGIAAVLVEYGNFPASLGPSHHSQQNQNNQGIVTAPKTPAHQDTPPIPTKPDLPKEKATTPHPKEKATTPHPKEKATTPDPKEKATTPDPKAIQFHVEIFTKNAPKPRPRATWPKVGVRIESTAQLALCASLLPKESAADADLRNNTDTTGEVSNEGLIDDAMLNWVKAMEQPLKQDLIRTLAEGTVNEFVKDAVKNSEILAEAVLLAPILDYEYYRILLGHIISKFEQSHLLDLVLLQGFVQVVQSASPGYLEADDLRRILSIVRDRLSGTLRQSFDYMFHLTVAISRILDIMADNKVSGLERVKEHDSLSGVFSELKGGEDPYILYQASYAFQALQYVQHDESNTQAFIRHTNTVVESVLKISSVLKLDAGEFFKGLKGIAETAGVLVETAKSVYGGVCSLIEGGQGVLDSLKGGFGTGFRRQWYLAIRQAEAFKREGQLAELNRLICEAPCRRDPFFQWGICQLLGDIAADSDWEVEKRQQAIDFLVTLFKDDAEWTRDESVKKWMKTILERLSKLPIEKRSTPRDIVRQDEAVKSYALTVLKGIPKDAASFQSAYPLMSRMPMPKSSALLKRVELDVKFDVDYLRDLRLSIPKPAVYIPPQAKASLKAPDKETFPLMTSVKDFLESERQVMLILGDSGSGKSTFNRHLERDLWTSYNPDDEDEPIPLFINLASIEDPEQDLVAKELRRLPNITESKIKELRESRRFILICDGYDETKSRSNLYIKNQLNEEGFWRAKMVITCRSTRVGVDYDIIFRPLLSDTYHDQTTDLFQEAVIAPFTSDQIKGYIDQYVLIVNRPQWNAQVYHDMLNGIPSLKGLVKNPFLLTIALEAMPTLVAAGRSKRDLERMRVNRLVLYDAVVQEWIAKAGRRLEKSKLTEAEMFVLDGLRQFGFQLKVTEYLKSLAADIFNENNGNPLVPFSEGADDESWKAKYFGRTPKPTILRLSSPLVRNGIDNSFIHLSVLEYFFSRVIYDPEKSNDLSPDNHPLAQKSILDDPSILEFLAERVQQESSKESHFKRQLLAVIEKSKSDESAEQAAANAITILVKAGIRFNGADLRGIRIPKADLSTGQFDTAQFQGANLSGVKFNKTWIRQADFSNADMTDVRFGELPHIELTARTCSCSYSPDGKTFAVGLFDGSIDIFDTVTWKKIRTLSDQAFASRITGRESGDIVRLAYSLKGGFLVSASEHGKLGVWNYHTGQLCRTLEGHLGGVTAVAVSPDGLQIASAGHDKTARLWRLNTGELERILVGHDYVGKTLVYSPDGKEIASGGYKGDVRLWNAHTGELGRVLSKESLECVYSVAFSPNGRWIVSGHRKGLVQLWNAKTGEPGRLLVGHVIDVMSVAFSHNSKWIASTDITVRLWDTETGAPCNILTGHTLHVECVSFSPTCLQFASGGHDRTVRIWELQDLYTNGPSLGVHNITEPLPFVKYSSSGQQVISANREGEVYQWDVQSADPLLLRRFGDTKVQSMAYSPNGLQIATASKSSDDFSVQLWNLATGEPGLVLTGHEDLVQNIFYSPCSRWIATASDDDQKINIWDTQATGNPLVHTFNNHACGISFSADGRWIAFGGFNRKICVHNTSTGELVATLKGHSDVITGVVYSPDSSLLGSSSWDCTVRLWDTTTNKLAAILRAHSNWVRCLDYSTCGKWIVTGSKDLTLRLWDVQSSVSSASDQINESTGVCVSVVQPFFAPVTHVSWNPNGEMEFVSSSAEHVIQAWKVVVGEEKSAGEVQDGAAAGAAEVSIQLDWSSESNNVVAIGTNVAMAKGLDDFGRALLKQRESAKENKLIGEDEMVE
ncbi:hypothetical protein EC991_003396 [Linnemannia zychae]|nr:hypothetical protein EC991_003396 [Linnemannia zychae]